MEKNSSGSTAEKKVSDTTKSSKTLPFFVLAILVVTLLAESFYDTDIDLEAYLPLLVAIGVGGAAKSAITRAAKAKNELTDEAKSYIDQEVKKLKAGNEVK